MLSSAARTTGLRTHQQLVDVAERAKDVADGLLQPSRTEGVYAARPEPAPSYHFSACVDTPRDVCLQRVRARGENPEGWIRGWRAAEAPLFVPVSASP